MVSSQLPAVSGATLRTLNGSSIASGTVAVSVGGTGLTSISTGDLLVGAAGNTISALGIGSTNGCLISNGTTAVWGSCASSGGSGDIFNNGKTVTVRVGSNNSNPVYLKQITQTDLVFRQLVQLMSLPATYLRAV